LFPQPREHDIPQHHLFPVAGVATGAEVDLFDLRPRLAGADVVAVAAEIDPRPVRLPLTLSLSRERAEHLTARAIREGKNLDTLVAEILERLKKR
jgi:hypothetical protein